MCLLAFPGLRYVGAESSQLDQDRASTFNDPRDSRAFLTSRWLTREAGGRVLGLPAKSVVVERACAPCGSTTHGRPRSGDAWLSTSRRRDLVAAAASDFPVAVDLEPLQSGAGIPDSCLTVEERGADRLGRLRLWTRKECLVKLGTSSLDDFGSFSAGDPQSDHVEVAGFWMSSHLAWAPSGEPHLVTVASSGPRPPTPALLSRRSGASPDLNPREAQG